MRRGRYECRGDKDAWYTLTVYRRRGPGERHVYRAIKLTPPPPPPSPPSTEQQQHQHQQQQHFTERGKTGRLSICLSVLLWSVDACLGRPWILFLSLPRAAATLTSAGENVEGLCVIAFRVGCFNQHLQDLEGMCTLWT